MVPTATREFYRSILEDPVYLEHLQRRIIAGRGETEESLLWTYFEMGDALPQGLGWLRDFFTSQAYIKSLVRRIEAGRARRMAERVRIVKANAGELARIIRDAHGAQVIIVVRGRPNADELARIIQEAGDHVRIHRADRPAGRGVV